MRINVEDIETDDIDNVPLLESTNNNNASVCIYDTKVLSIRDTRARNKLIAACVLCMLFMIGEVIGGLLANSLAILTDSAHLFSDLSSFIVGLVAMLLSNRPSSKTMTFGWHRTEVIGALFSVLFIWAVTGVLVYMAILRIINHTFLIDSTVMLIMSGIGVIVNIIMAFVLHPHSHSHEHSHSHGHGHSHTHTVPGAPFDSYQPLLSPVSDSITPNGVKQYIKKTKIQNINLRAAFIHVIGDIIQSFGVLIASFIIYFKPEWKIADPICTFIFSILVVFTTLSIFGDVVCVLLERKPRHLSHSTISNRLLALQGVSQCHNLRLWSITMNRTAATCHLIINDKTKSKQILDQANHVLAQEYSISEVTIQIETGDNEPYVVVQ